MLNVTKNDEKGVVIIGDIEIKGFVDDESCQKCLKPRIYYDDYDAFFCPYCNVWLESACSDSTCEFCRKRPEKPLKD